MTWDQVLLAFLGPGFGLMVVVWSVRMAVHLFWRATGRKVESP
jgi:steroid 5-alpha reductase family enzyme